MAEFQVKNASLRPQGLPISGNSLQESFSQLQQAEQLRQHGRLDQAQAICETLVQRHPDYAAALHTLGLVLGDKENHRDALTYLVRAAMLDPQNWMTLTALSGVYLRLGAIEMATQTIERARSIKPHDANVLLLLGDILREDREYEQAREAYRQAVAIDPSLAPAASALGWCCADVGEFREAVEIFESLIKRGMRSVEPLRALATFPAANVHIDLLAQSKSALKDPGEDATDFETSVAFVRATALERAGRHSEAWEQAVRANRKIFQAMQGALQTFSDRQDRGLTALREHSGILGRGGISDRRPLSVFILGPSRSGKTTMEKLVSTLPGVKRGYENPIIERAVRRTFQTSALPPDSALAQLPPPAYPLCRDIYREKLARRIGGAEVFTNTYSGCIFEAAHIISVFENVRFILMKRNVEDNLLRIYMRKYGGGNAYAYDLKAARDHILWYHQMIDLIAEKFPAIVRVINYEDMVASTTASLRIVAELCGMPTPDGLSPSVEGDIGCAAPYRDFMAIELEN